MTICISQQLSFKINCGIVVLHLMISSFLCSDDNLVKDDFLKSNMDDQGWVAISLIAGFPRVSHLQLIV